jgi:hypothetical protein
VIEILEVRCGHDLQKGRRIMIQRPVWHNHGTVEFHISELG